MSVRVFDCKVHQGRSLEAESGIELFSVARIRSHVHATLGLCKKSSTTEEKNAIKKESVRRQDDLESSNTKSDGAF